MELGGGWGPPRLPLRRGLGRFSGARKHCMTTKAGRPQSIPPTAYAEVNRLHGLGYGYQRISAMLEERGIFTTRSSIYQLLNGLRPYMERRVMNLE